MTMSATVDRLMFDFARRSGLEDGDRAVKRYLWTDAFAVCNFLGIYTESSDERAGRLARRLVDQVHHVLGRQRADDPRRGWISGLDEAEGEKHPTIGGLRIGKDLPERRAGEACDEALEWERDGQYFHYLTKWMHALERVGEITGEATYRHWAVELAKVAFARFTYRTTDDGRARMYWKMSIDLGRPQVASMGHHDPLDGLVTYLGLRAHGGDGIEQTLDPEIDTFARICAGRSWVTDDALGIGELLCHAYKLARLATKESATELRLLEDLLWAAARGLEAVTTGHSLGYTAESRLAFRELGLSIGLRALRSLRDLCNRLPGAFPRHAQIGTALRAIAPYEQLGESIESFWLEPSNRQARSWTAHRDINDVMLATSLAPGGFLIGVH